MVAGKDISLTFEPNPMLLDYLLPTSNITDYHEGLALAGECSIRPHYSAEYDIYVSLLSQLRHDQVRIVRLPDSEALLCMNSSCKMVGLVSQEATAPLSKRQLRRVMRAFHWAFVEQQTPAAALPDLELAGQGDLGLGDSPAQGP